MNRHWRSGLVALLVLLEIGGRAWSQSPEKVVRRVDEARSGLTFSLLDLCGTAHELGQNDLARVRAFVFLSTECPIANSYTRTLNELHERVCGTADARVELFGADACAGGVRVGSRRAAGLSQGNRQCLGGVGATATAGRVALSGRCDSRDAENRLVSASH